MNTFIEQLNWRYATKKFNATKTISKQVLDEIIEVFRLTPSSFGLEPWKLIVIEDKEIKKKLAEHSFGQEQVAENSHLLVFCSRTDIDNGYIDAFINRTGETIGKTPQELEKLEKIIKGYFHSLDMNAQKLWASNQVYLALGFVMSYLAQKEIDSCAIGGFSPEGYDEILHLSEQGLRATVVLPIGYRDPDDGYIKKPKVRFDTDEIVQFI